MLAVKEGRGLVRADMEDGEAGWNGEDRPSTRNGGQHLKVFYIKKEGFSKALHLLKVM